MGPDGSSKETTRIISSLPFCGAHADSAPLCCRMGPIKLLKSPLTGEQESSAQKRRVSDGDHTETSKWEVKLAHGPLFNFPPQKVYFIMKLRRRFDSRNFTKKPSLRLPPMETRTSFRRRRTLHKRAVADVKKSPGLLVKKSTSREEAWVRNNLPYRNKIKSGYFFNSPTALSRSYYITLNYINATFIKYLIKTCAIRVSSYETEKAAWAEFLMDLKHNP